MMLNVIEIETSIVPKFVLYNKIFIMYKITIMPIVILEVNFYWSNNVSTLINTKYTTSVNSKGKYNILILKLKELIYQII